jgi:hypothetical protein
MFVLGKNIFKYFNNANYSLFNQREIRDVRLDAGFTDEPADVVRCSFRKC